MYLDFHGFRERPFNLTPDPRFVFLSKNHKETFAHLLYGINNRVGFIALTGEVGSGKTTVLRSLLNQLGTDRHRTALIFNPCLSPTELLQNVNREFGILADTTNHSLLLDSLNRFLLEQNAADRTVVLVIDEAQNLDASVLEQIRLISNLETEQEKLVQIVLSGQPELAQMLLRDEMRQLSQRITVRYHLGPMDFHDTVQYINHRLDVAGKGDAAIFSKPAIKRIYRYSRGLPRLINIACDRALLAAYTRNRTWIGSRIARAGIKDIKRHESPNYGKRKLILIPTLAVLAAFVAVPIYIRWNDFLIRWDDLLAYFKARNPVAAVVVEEQAKVHAALTGEDLFRAMSGQLGQIPESESARKAFNTIAALWKVSPVPDGRRLGSPDALVSAAQDRKLQIHSFSGNLGALLRLDYPAALELNLPGLTGRRFVSLVGLDEGQLVIDPVIAGRPSLSFGEIERHWSGKAFLFWKDPLDLRTVSSQSKGEPMKRLQGILKEAGVFRKPPTGVYDGDTLSAVREFQSAKGIDADGIVGPRTLMALYRSIDHFEVPALSAGRK